MWLVFMFFVVFADSFGFGFEDRVAADSLTGQVEPFTTGKSRPDQVQVLASRVPDQNPNELRFYWRVHLVLI